LRAGTHTPLRIAVVAPPWFEIPPSGYGGIERVCYSLVQGLTGLGHEVTLVATGSNRTSARFAAVFDQPVRGLGTEFHPVQEVRYAAGVARVLRELEIDIIHDHSLAGPLAAPLKSIPTLLTAHGPTGALLGDYFRRLALPLVAISEFQRRSAPDLPWISTIPHGIELEQYPYRQDKDDFVLFLGRLSAEKGAHLAVDAARKAGVRLIISGKAAEPAERRYFEECVAPRMTPDTEFIGESHGSRRTDLLSRARGVLAPAQWDEPFGLAAVEALACGTPVIGLRRGSLPEIVDHGLTGWICDDPAELPDAIGRLDELDPRTCRSVAAERYGTAAMVSRYENVYRLLVGAAP
jgi:glycosyltransferase involved in cell wall biosynthesis